MAKYDLSEGEYEVAGARVAVVAARFNEDIVGSLLEGALQTLARHGVAGEQLTVIRVPGAFEIPLIAKRLAQSRRYDAVLTLGAVIRGGTPHFEYVAGECAAGVNRAALDTGVPVIFGVLTVDDMRQARDRAGGAEGNKGHEAALAALEMVALLRQLEA